MSSQIHNPVVKVFASYGSFTLTETQQWLDFAFVPDNHETEIPLNLLQFTGAPAGVKGWMQNRQFTEEQIASFTKYVEALQDPAAIQVFVIRQPISFTP